MATTKKLVNNKINYRKNLFPELNKKEDYTNLQSQTIPDLALSIDEILYRHSRGMQIATKLGQYQEDYPELGIPISELNKKSRLELEILQKEVISYIKQQQDAEENTNPSNATTSEAPPESGAETNNESEPTG